MNIQKLIIWLIVIALVIGVSVFGFKKLGNKPSTSKTQQTPVKQQVVDDVNKTEIASTELPSNFPTDIPLEAGAQVVENFNASGTQGSQGTRSFVSAKTLAENLAIYTNYMKANGWKIEATVNNPNSKMVSGSKNSKRLQVTIDQNTTTKKVAVTIYLIQ